MPADNVGPVPDQRIRFCYLNEDLLGCMVGFFFFLERNISLYTCVLYWSEVELL